MAFVLGWIYWSTWSREQSESASGPVEHGAERVLEVESAEIQPVVRSGTQIVNDKEPLSEANDKEQTDGPSNGSDPEDDVVLEYEAQEYIRGVAYEITTLPNISEAGYLDQITCEESGCEVKIRFFEKRAMVSRTSSLLDDLNSRLESNPQTAHVQFGFTALGNDAEGFGVLDLVTMPKRDHSYSISIVEDLNIGE